MTSPTGFTHRVDMSNYPTPSFDITALLRDGRHFAEKRGDRIHIVDSLTGNTYITYAQDSLPGVSTRFTEHTAPNGTIIWIEEGLNPNTAGGTPQIAYSPALIHIMCHRIATGKGITKICEDSDMPSYPVLRMWAQQHPWIDEAFDRARRDRAEHHRDEALEVAKNTQARDQVDADKLKVETLKWAAGVDHEKYNPKTKVEATINTPTQIVVFTGIDRTQGQVVTQAPPRDVGSSVLQPTIPVDMQRYTDEK